MNKRKVIPLFAKKMAMRILSLFLAVVIWLIVAFTISPNIDRTILAVPVVIDENDDVLINLGLNLIDQKGQTVDVHVNGIRMAVANLKPEDFIATASLEQVKEAGTYEKLKVEVSPKNPTEDYEIISAEPKIVSAKFDRVTTKNFRLSVDSQFTALPDCVVGKHTIYPSDITISGPEASVAMVSECLVQIEKTMLSKTSTFVGAVVMLDQEGNVIEDSQLRLSKEFAEVTIPISKNKTLPIDFTFTGLSPDAASSFTALNFFQSLKRTVTVDSINISGPPEQVDLMSELDVGYINVKNLRPDNNIFPFDITLPQGFQNNSAVDSVTVEFDLSEYSTRKYNVTNIVVKNSPSNFETIVETKKIYNIEIVAKPSDLERITGDDIVAELSFDELSGVTPGNKALAVSIVVPGYKAWAVGDYSVIVTILDEGSGEDEA